MQRLETFSTDSQPPHQRIDYWHHVTCSALTPQIAAPFDPESFRGHMTRLDFEDVRVVELNASASRVSHTRLHVRCADQPVYLLRLALRGNITLLQDRRETRLRPGDFTLCDASRPYQTYFRNASDVLVLRVPRERLLRYIGRPEHVIGVSMSGDSGLSGLASRHLRELWRTSQDFLRHGALPRLIEINLQLLAAAYSAIPEASVEHSHPAAALRTQIVELIERELSDPDLTPASIAGKLGISTGYVHRAFARESSTLCRYILQRRLDGIARALKDPSQAQRSITEIALDLGFKSLPHFSRVFRERYGMSPRDYRHS